MEEALLIQNKVLHTCTCIRSKINIDDLRQPNSPVYAEWDIPLLSTGSVYDRFKGCKVIFFIFIKILIELSISKQWRSSSDAAFCGV